MGTFRSDRRRFHSIDLRNFRLQCSFPNAPALTAVPENLVLTYLEFLVCDEAMSHQGVRGSEDA